MGVYLTLATERGVDLPDWDFGLSGDRDLAAALIDIPHHTAPGWPVCDTSVIRPNDLEQALNHEAALDPDRENPGRWRDLIERLIADPTVWVMVSW